MTPDATFTKWIGMSYSSGWHGFSLYESLIRRGMSEEKIEAMSNAIRLSVMYMSVAEIVAYFERELDFMYREAAK